MSALSSVATGPLIVLSLYLLVCLSITGLTLTGLYFIGVIVAGSNITEVQIENV